MNKYGLCIINFLIASVVLYSCQSHQADINDEKAIIQELMGTWENKSSIEDTSFWLNERYEFSGRRYKHWISLFGSAISKSNPASEATYELSYVKTKTSNGTKFRSLMMEEDDSGKQSSQMSFVEGYGLVSGEDKNGAVFKKVNAK